LAKDLVSREEQESVQVIDNERDFDLSTILEDVDIVDDLDVEVMENEVLERR